MSVTVNDDNIWEVNPSQGDIVLNTAGTYLDRDILVISQADYIQQLEQENLALRERLKWGYYGY